MIVGWAPIFGKMAYREGVDPYTLAALRTILAAAMLWVIYLVCWRPYIRIDWRNLLGCISIGAVNGIACGGAFYMLGAYASYTLSRTEGNHFADFSSALGDYYANATSTGISGFIVNSANKYGLASYDRTHDVKGYGAYTLQLGRVTLTPGLVQIERRQLLGQRRDDRQRERR